MEEHPALVKLTKAEQALDAAKDLRDIKKIIDVAEAARVYIRAAKIGEGAARHAEEIKLKAQRKAGECLTRLQKSKGGRLGRRNSAQAAPSSEYRKAVEDAGIEKTAAKRYQQVAAVPAPEFADYLKAKKEHSEEITTAGLLS